MGSDCFAPLTKWHRVPPRSNAVVHLTGGTFLCASHRVSLLFIAFHRGFSYNPSRFLTRIGGKHSHMGRLSSDFQKSCERESHKRAGEGLSSSVALPPPPSFACVPAVCSALLGRFVACCVPRGLSVCRAAEDVGAWGWVVSCRVCVVSCLLVVVLSVVACARVLWFAVAGFGRGLRLAACVSRSARLAAVRALLVVLCVALSRLGGFVGVVVPRVGDSAGVAWCRAVLWGWVLIWCRVGVGIPLCGGGVAGTGDGSIWLCGAGGYGCPRLWGTPVLTPLCGHCMAPVCGSRRCERPGCFGGVGGGRCRPRWGCSRPPVAGCPLGMKKPRPWGAGAESGRWGQPIAFMSSSTVGLVLSMSLVAAPNRSKPGMNLRCSFSFHSITGCNVATLSGSSW